MRRIRKPVKVTAPAARETSHKRQERVTANSDTPRVPATWMAKPGWDPFAVRYDHMPHDIGGVAKRSRDYSFPRACWESRDRESPESGSFLRLMRRTRLGRVHASWRKNAEKHLCPFVCATVCTCAANSKPHTPTHVETLFRR